MTIKRHILNLFQSTDDVALGFFTRIGPYVTAAIPALLAGYGLYKQFSGPDTDSWFGVVIGIAVGIGFEAAGIKIIHSAIEYSDRTKRIKDVRFILLVIASLIFVGLVSFTIFTADKAYPGIVRIVGGISPILAAMAYFAIGVEKSMEREERVHQEEHAITLEFEREKQKIILEAERAKIKAEAEAEVQRINAKAAAEQERLKAMSEAEAIRLKNKAEEEATANEHHRQIELQKLEQKHEKAMKKMESVSTSKDTQVEQKPFRRYDEFQNNLEETQDNNELAHKMNVSPATIRRYRRLCAKFEAETSSNDVRENVTETDELAHAEMNGHI